MSPLHPIFRYFSNTRPLVFTRVGVLITFLCWTLYGPHSYSANEGKKLTCAGSFSTDSNRESGNKDAANSSETNPFGSFALWIADNRDRLGWSYETLSEKLTRNGYPTATNKIWRAERETPQKVDTYFLAHLEYLFGTKFYFHELGDLTPIALMNQTEWLDVVALWIKGNRGLKGWSIETLARKIVWIGYPITQNKIFRTESGTVKKIDVAFLAALQQAFGQRFRLPASSQLDRGDMIPLNDVIDLINSWKVNPDLIEAPEDIHLKVILELLRDSGKPSQAD